MTDSIRTMNAYLTTRWHLVSPDAGVIGTTYAMNTPAGCVLLVQFSEHFYYGEAPAAAASSGQTLLPGVRLDQRWEAQWVEPDEDEDGERRLVLRRVYKLRSSSDRPASRTWEWYDADDAMPRPSDAEIRAAAGPSRGEK